MLLSFHSAILQMLATCSAIPGVTGWHDHTMRRREVFPLTCQFNRYNVSKEPLAESPPVSFIRIVSRAHVTDAKEMRTQVQGIFSIYCGGMLSQQARKKKRERAVLQASTSLGTGE